MILLHLHHAVAHPMKSGSEIFFVVISSSWLVYTRFDQKWSFQGVAIVYEVASVVVNLIRWLFGSIFILEVGVQSVISPWCC